MLQISFFAELGTQGQRQLAVKFKREGECDANEVWQINPEVVTQKLVQILTRHCLRHF